MCANDTQRTPAAQMRVYNCRPSFLCHRDVSAGRRSPESEKLHGILKRRSKRLRRGSDEAMMILRLFLALRPGHAL
jgi:hypothetical protein